jgi:hypothetical protein
MKNIFKYTSSSLVITLLPYISFGAEKKTLATLIDVIIGYFDQFLLLLMGLAIVIFTWNVIKYYIRPGADRTEAGNYVLYSVIGFFVLLSFWGIVNVLQETFGLKNEDNRPSSWSSFQSLFPTGKGNKGDNSWTVDDEQGFWESYFDTTGDSTDSVGPNGDSADGSFRDGLNVPGDTIPDDLIDNNSDSYMDSVNLLDDAEIN